jgi:hypothetical protein
MATKATTSARAPRGTKVLTQAFFTAADEVPEAQRGAVVKAALAAIRDELKAVREKAAAAKTKAKGKSAASTSLKKIGRPVGSENKVTALVAPKAKEAAAKLVKAKKSAPAAKSRTTAKAKKAAPTKATKKAAKAAPKPMPTEAPSQEPTIEQAAAE